MRPRAECHLSPADGDTTADYSFYYQRFQVALSGDHDEVESDSALSGNMEYCLIRKRLTAPEQICIPYGLVAAASDHVVGCDPNFGSRPGMGVNDLRY